MNLSDFCHSPVQVVEQGQAVGSDFCLDDVDPVLDGLTSDLKSGGYLSNVKFTLIDFGDHLTHRKLVLLHAQLTQ